MLPLRCPSPIHLPALLRSISITRLRHYYERSDSCSPGSSGLVVHELHLCRQAGLPDSRGSPSCPFRLHPPSAPLSSLLHATPQLVESPALTGLGFAIHSQARRHRPAESSLLSYGWIVHLLLLPTPPHGDAVAFGYRPESVCLERTFTSLIMCAFRRTAGGLSSPSG